MDPIFTTRLKIRELTLKDCAFILELVNEPLWLRFIGDKGVKTAEDAERYILNGPVDMYKRLGIGLLAVEVIETGLLVGMCGLIKRDTLDDVDLGFALLERYFGNGYAYESAAAVMDYAEKGLGLKRVVAITTLDNHASAKLLLKLGFEFEENIESENDETLKLFGWGEKGKQLIDSNPG